MKTRLLKFLPFLLGACVVLMLATLLVRMRYELEITHDTLRLHALLDAERVQLSDKLDQGERRLSVQAPAAAADDWHAWTLDAKGYRGADGQSPPIAERALRRALNQHVVSNGHPVLLGPFGTDRGRDALVLATLPDARNPDNWHGVWMFVEDLMTSPAADNLSKQGFRLQLYDHASAAAFYQTGRDEFTAAVSQPLQFPGAQLELRGASRLPQSRFLSSSLLVFLAVMIWLTFELRRGHASRTAAADLAEAETRRKESNTLYGKALENVATLESQLHMVSMYDTVTGLANRASLIRRIDSTLDSMRQSPQGALCVMAVGFDHVHHITNSFGTEFSSRVLVIAAERVEFVLPSKDLLFRTGDFHLAVVLPQTDSRASQELAEKIVAEIQAPIALDSHTFMLHPSIGIAEAASGYEYAEKLLDRAQAALSAVPRDAPSRVCLFDSAAAKDSVSRLQLEVDLDRAFEENQFVLEYEPFVAPVTYALAGFEALIRWNHPTEGRLSPARFVPIAVQAGLSHRLNTWVMREAARQASEWRRAGYLGFFVNFNLSAEAFLRPNLTDEVAEVLAEFELPGSHLVVELTESTLIQDIRGAARILQRLGELGVAAWLDDFGTGYSSLSHLRALPLKGVKIDKSFIERIVIDSRDCGFLKALIDLIGYLGMQSIAEGIETKEQYELLSLTSCNLYQGYHFSRSMPAAQAERWMKAPQRALRRGILS